MNDNVNIFILTHGNWGKALIESMELITGEIEKVRCFSLTPDLSFIDFKNSIKEEADKLVEMKEEILFISDLNCGSTSNVACLLAQEYKMEAISGLSLELLIAAEELRTEVEYKFLADEIIRKTKEGISKINLLERR